MAAIIVVAVTRATTQNWREQRKAESEKTLRVHRSRVYEELVASAVRTLAAASPSDIAKERASLALWGSDQVLSEFAEWQRVSTQVARDANVALDTSVKVEPWQRPALYDQIWQCIRVTRADVEASEASRDAVLSMLFNNYEEVKDEAARMRRDGTKWPLWIDRPLLADDAQSATDNDDARPSG